MSRLSVSPDVPAGTWAVTLRSGRLTAISTHAAEAAAWIRWCSGWWREAVLEVWDGESWIEVARR